MSEKTVLISIRSEWCKKIANGIKSIEVRKTRPKMNPPFKCYIYCTQSADMLWILKERERSLHPDKIADVFKAAKCGGAYLGNGNVMGEFLCDQIDILRPVNEPYGIYDVDDDYVLQTCLENGALWDYGHGKTLYGWHIAGLEIYDAPKKLEEFRAPELPTGLRYEADVIKRPPQSWRYVEEAKRP